MEPKFFATPTFNNENNLQDIFGFIKTLTEKPTYIPRRLHEQFVMVTAGGSTSAYLYETSSATWLHASLT